MPSITVLSLSGDPLTLDFRTSFPSEFNETSTTNSISVTVADLRRRIAYEKLLAYELVKVMSQSLSGVENDADNENLNDGLTFGESMS